MKKWIPMAAFLTVLVGGSVYAQAANFFELVKNGRPQIVRAALDQGADINARNEDGRTPLMVAITNNNNTEVFSLLLKAGADINARDKDGSNPLMLAAGGGNIEVVMLLNAGANTNTRNVFSRTPLMYATIDGQSPDVITTLLRAGADVSAHDKDSVE